MTTQSLTTWWSHSPAWRLRPGMRNLQMGLISVRDNACTLYGVRAVDDEVWVMWRHLLEQGVSERTGRQSRGGCASARCVQLGAPMPGAAFFGPLLCSAS